MIESFKSFIPERSKIFTRPYLQIKHPKIREKKQKKTKGKKKWRLVYMCGFSAYANLPSRISYYQ